MTASWETSSLSEATEFVGRGVSPKYIDADGVRVLNQRCVRDHRVQLESARRHDATAKKVPDQKLLRVGDVLVNSTGVGTLGRVAQIRDSLPEPTTVDSHVAIARPRADLFDPEFFGYAMVAIEDQIAAAGQGSGGQTELSRTALSSFRVRYPVDVKEQKRIVAILDAAFADIDAAQEAVDTCLQRSGEVFTKKLDSIIQGAPADWRRTKLGDLAEFRNGLNFTKSSSGESVNVIGVKDFQNRFYAPEDGLDTVMIDGALAEIDQVRPGDLLSVRSNGNQALIGRTMLVVESDKKTSHSGFTIRIRLKDQDALSPAFVCLALRSDAVRQGVIGKGTGTSIRSLSQGVLAAVEVPIPPREIQDAVVTDLAILSAESDSLLRCLRDKIGLLTDLRQSILHQAFSGQL